MGDFLTSVSTVRLKPAQDSSLLLQETKSTKSTPGASLVDSPETALKALKEQPDPATLNGVLSFLSNEAVRKHGFHLMIPDPVAANIVYQLVNTTIPDYWRTLQQPGLQEKQLVECLRNPCGVGNILTRLRPLITDCQQKKPVGNERDSASHIEDLLDVLGKALEGDEFLKKIWVDVEDHAKNAGQAKLIWRELVSQVASGRILSVVAEAEDVLKERDRPRKTGWLGDGKKYASWLGRNIAMLMKGAGNSEQSTAAVLDMCSKTLSLGYTDCVVQSMLLPMIDTDSIDTFSQFFRTTKAFEQRKYMSAIITFLVKQYFGSMVDKDGPLKSSPRISGVAKLITELVKDSDILLEHLVHSLIKSSIPILEDSLDARRSVIAAMAQCEDQLHTLLEMGLKLLGDSYYIKHTPIVRQEALAQTLAITCGYVQRSQPMFLMMMAKSTHHVSGMSNRIGSSSPRARFLGIAVGTAISKMVDKPELQLKFELDDEEAAEAAFYQRLTEVNDKLGSIDDLKIQEEKQAKPSGSKPKNAMPKSAPKPKPSITEVKGPRIVEVLSDGEDEDADLIPYAKPDSDPEDDTDDPTEINRNKPTAPVYIRDLISGLRDTENYDRHALALSTAAPLIRRKANFGTEVVDHIEELASILVGLNDNFELEDFAENRQQALIALLLAKPSLVAQWLARTFFTGDYSLAQRTAILTTLGLGARELAGLKDDTTASSPSPSFPSQKLPPHLDALYTTTSSLTKKALTPLAAHAADTLSGPSILKIRTFSSRMAVEARRKKPTPNALAKIVAEDFFFPLTGRWWIAMRSSSSSTTLSSDFSSPASLAEYTSSAAHATTTTTTTTPHLAASAPHLLPPFLHTLALLLHAAGPAALALPQMTRELWDVALAARRAADDGDTRVLAALLSALVVLLETNEGAEERLATEHGRELLETLAWARGVFSGLPGGGKGEGEKGGEDERVRALAAGVVVRCQEVVDRYQRRLVGSMMDY